MIVNPLILPPQPLVMIFGGLAVLVGLVFPWLGKLAMGITWPLLAYTIRSVELLARLPQGSLGLGDVTLWGVAGFYLILLTITLAWKKLPKKQRLTMRWLTASLVVALSASLVWQSVLALPDGRLHVTVFAVDDGPAILVQGPQGARLLVNGGSRASQLSDALGRRLPFHQRSLEGLPDTLLRFPAGEAYISADVDQWQAGRTVVDEFAADGLPIHDLAPGETILLDEAVSIQVLAVTSQGTALLIEQGAFRMLIPGGVSLYTLNNLGAAQSLSAVLLSAPDLALQMPQACAWRAARTPLA